jgi:pheromone receptor transcription factor
MQKLQRLPLAKVRFFRSIEGIILITAIFTGYFTHCRCHRIFQISAFPSERFVAHFDKRGYSFSGSAPSRSRLHSILYGLCPSNSTNVPTSPNMRKRQRTMDMHNSNPADPSQQPPPAAAAAAAAAQQQQPGQPQSQPPITEDGFIQDNDAVDSAVEDDDEEEKPKSDKKAGRRKIKIEFIQDKSRRHITFSQRKAGIMKKAYELSTLTGTQVLLLVVSETGLVYTFTTAKLQPLFT